MEKLSIVFNQIELTHIYYKPVFEGKPVHHITGYDDLARFLIEHIFVKPIVT